MLCRIQDIRGIGLFHETSGSKYKLEKLALIYAGNGRGKSTLASILTSVSTGDSQALEERKTIDGTTEPAIKLQFDSGHKVEFESGAWSETRPEVKIFDTTFIEQNVHSGGQVSADHRKNLLDFAIGDRAVTLRLAEETAVTDQKVATASVQSINRDLSAFSGDLQIPVFRSLTLDKDADVQLESLQKRQVDAQRAGSITSLNVPGSIPVPDVDIEAIFGVLGKTLDNIHDEAATQVEDHVARLGDPEAVDWLNQGQIFDDEIHCPYCGQSTDGISLIKMYRTHFNEAYGTLKELVAATRSAITQQLSLSILENIIEHREQVNEKLIVWSEYIATEKLPTDLDGLAEASLKNLSDLLEGLIKQKISAPAEAIGTPDQNAEAIRLLQQFRGIYIDQNAIIAKYVSEIEAFKRNLQNEDPAEISRAITRIQLSKVRHSVQVKALFAQLSTAENGLKKAEEDKREAREQLSALMSTTLTQYSQDINRHLANLGASFQISAIKTNYAGSKPRTDYAISLRGKSVKLTNDNPSFATVLSEGDKRTLAFAFFIASTLADPDIANHIVVIDDPVSSLDRSRRSYTMKILSELSDRSAQLILLAHDANFLRETARNLTKENDALKVSSLQILRIEKGYSGFGQIDLDRECETPYYTHYRTVDEYVTGSHSDVKQTAVALRPLLEGYLHRKFPGKLPSNLTLGSVLSEIDTAATPNAFTAIKNNIAEFRDLNAFAGKFHHDTNPGYQTEVVDPDEVVAFSRRVLAAVHGS
ncbi:AAA family ATPase [Arthrobacter citreus]|uniref:AAA family ATPase n=1 Tax=Arthrobacter citreus TaxID=1670 RepID=UPI003827AE3D